MKSSVDFLQVRHFCASAVLLKPQSIMSAAFAAMHALQA
jgi:hypothetical protein